MSLSAPEPAGAAAAPDRTTRHMALCVDLDGTLVLSDTMMESILLVLRRRPWAIVTLALWLLAGRASFKRRVAARATPDPALLPYNAPLLAYLRAEKARGRTVALYSASDQRVVDAIAAHLGLFDAAHGSDGRTNLSGRNKLAAMRADYPDGFVYAGNDPRADRPVFAGADGAVLAGRPERLSRGLPGAVPVEAVFEVRPMGVRDWIKALRLHQWSKNTLVFAPLVLAGHEITAGDAWAALRGFLAFGAIASATYLVNDLLDIEADRRHPTKRRRPFASGRLSVPVGLVAVAVPVALALALTATLPGLFAEALAGYVVLSLTYSLGLKRVPPVDVVALAGLFTIRILAGMSFGPQPVSFWFLTFAMFFFLGLANVKRYTELDMERRRGADRVADRGYRVADMPMVAAAGQAAGVGAMLVFVIYLINEKFPGEIYGQPTFLWFIVPILLVWQQRVWLLTGRGEMRDDPIAFAIRDVPSLAMGLGVLLLVAAAW
ncbi:MAG: UbiA family prenyltransferase [Azospirillaceae bacterium]